MARFYLDENVSERLVSALQSLGSDTLSTDAAGNKGLSDPRQLLFAYRMRRILITHNMRDFAMLHQAWIEWPHGRGVLGGVAHPGILIVQQEHGLSIVEMAGIVEQFVAEVDLLANRLFAWKPTEGWGQGR